MDVSDVKRLKALEEENAKLKRLLAERRPRRRREHCKGWDGRKSKVRAHVEHVFAEQKARMGLVVRTIGPVWATTKIGLANLVYRHAPPDPARTTGGTRLSPAVEGVRHPYFAW